MRRKYTGRQAYRLLLCVTVAFVVSGTNRPAQARAEGQDRGSTVAEKAFSPALFERQCAEIQRHLERSADDLWTRNERLVRLGDALSYHGIVDAAAAAYLMALADQGLTERTEAVAMRLAWCLAPLDTRTTCVQHRPAGPRAMAGWAGRRIPTCAESTQAIAVYELIARQASTEQLRGRACLAMGWLYRATNQWEKSTAAWLRCTDVVRGTREAGTAYWLAAENLEWNSRSAEAAELLRGFLSAYPTDSRAALARRRIEDLEAEGARGDRWLTDPVTGLGAEIEAASGERPPYRVYRAACRWLERRGLHAQLIDVSRWATTQVNWPVEERVAAQAVLSSALLPQGQVDADAKAEAAEALGAIVELAERDSEVISAAVRQCVILRDLGEFERALAALETVRTKTAATASRDRRLLPEAIRVFTALGDRQAAASALARLATAAPDHSELGRLRRLVKEGF